MRLLFKQRIFSWFDSYDIFNEFGDTVFTVKGELSWGKLLNIYDASGKYVGSLKQKIFRFLPTFEMYFGNRLVGTIQKEFTFFRPSFHIDCNGWYISGNWIEWDYMISSPSGEGVAVVSKEIFNWTDTYVIDVRDPANAVAVLMIVLAIDSEKDTRD
ncbi:MAG: LURP-one-related family protein [Clostridia bacterium]|nr:LURP-one-related family protein [Clostridia bacterium]